ncbi:hypothetical protein SAMN05216353_12515 [Halobacillus alkaliphilus]|uniref:Uncharacterized protein n=1 Tax=Halobacillus alkaliphilus TaxID=396056 RepID=A0A1I2PI60_9BACI|nr:hypothetical protein [Halobacillus alkaliphilus]SFG14799.1 hypothetical protein SAMN05216353_12515 [Halobacillus alkaliphilus]
MKVFLLMFVSILITDFLSTQVYAWIDLEYRLFQDTFNLWLFLLDFGIFLLIAMGVYSLLSKIFSKGSSARS